MQPISKLKLQMQLLKPQNSMALITEYLVCIMLTNMVEFQCQSNGHTSEATHTSPSVYLVLTCTFFLFFQNVPPAILLRFLREHRSEWADSSIDAYSAAAIKAGPCSLPGVRAGSFGGQVILPLAHTIEHEEASESVLTYSHQFYHPSSQKESKNCFSFFGVVIVDHNDLLLS